MPQTFELSHSAQDIDNMLTQLKGFDVYNDEYFDIDIASGVICLKPEYRGAVPVGTDKDLPASHLVWSSSVSDQQLGSIGSKNTQLPERLIIPSNVDGITVTGFQAGMFSYNHRIKEVVLPSSIKNIPDGMFCKAIYLEKIENIEQIETIGKHGIAFTRVRELNFPNLKTIDSYCFCTSPCLEKINIGNKIKEIPVQAFAFCENLLEVTCVPPSDPSGDSLSDPSGGSSEFKIGERAFYGTRRLRELSFINNLPEGVTSGTIGNYAFLSSRCDFSQMDKGWSYKDATSAIYAQFDSGFTPSIQSDSDLTPHWGNYPQPNTGERPKPLPWITPLNSVFHQKDPEWADKVVDENLIEDGKQLTYGANGCAFFSLATIYSAFTGESITTYEKVKNFKDKFPIDENTKTIPNFRYGINQETILKYLLRDQDYTIQWFTTDDKYQDHCVSEEKMIDEIYNTLHKGGLVFRNIAATGPNGGHAAIYYGINADGEILMSDTSMHCDRVGIYKNHKCAWHLYKHVSNHGSALIIYPNTNKEGTAT